MPWRGSYRYSHCAWRPRPPARAKYLTLPRLPQRDQIAFPKPMVPTPLDDFKKHIAAIALNEGLQKESRSPVRGNRPVHQNAPRPQRVHVQPMPGQTFIELLVIPRRWLHKTNAPRQQDIYRRKDIRCRQRNMLDALARVIGQIVLHQTRTVSPFLINGNAQRLARRHDHRQILRHLPVRMHCMDLLEMKNLQIKFEPVGKPPRADSLREMVNLAQTRAVGVQHRARLLRVEPREINVVDRQGFFARLLPAFPMVHEVNMRIPDPLDRGDQQLVRPDPLTLELPRLEFDDSHAGGLRIEHSQPDGADAHAVRLRKP